MFKLILFSLFSLFILVQADYDGVYVKLPDEEIPKVIDASNQCIKETGADPEILQRFIKFEINRDMETDRKYAYCVLSKAGYADKNGKLLTDRTSHLANGHEQTEELLAVVNKCNSEVTGTDATYVMVDIINCFHKNSPIYHTI